MTMSLVFVSCILNWPCVEFMNDLLHIVHLFSNFSNISQCNEILDQKTDHCKNIQLWSQSFWLPKIIRTFEYGKTFATFVICETIVTSSLARSKKSGFEGQIFQINEVILTKHAFVSSTTTSQNNRPSGYCWPCPKEGNLEVREWSSFTESLAHLIYITPLLRAFQNGATSSVECYII